MRDSLSCLNEKACLVVVSGSKIVFVVTAHGDLLLPFVQVIVVFVLRGLWVGECFAFAGRGLDQLVGFAFAGRGLDQLVGFLGVVSWW